MSSLKSSIAQLESDLRQIPPRIAVYRDLPFAILRYAPTDEWELRRELRLLVTRLESTGTRIHVLSVADLLYEALERISATDDDEGLHAIIELEKQRGFLEAQQQLTTYLSSSVWQPLWELLTEKLNSFNPDNSIVFLTRAAAMSPGIFQMSQLLDKMHGRSRVHTVLFYPGSIEGTTGLRFMDLRDRDALGNYRVKIYG